MAVEEKGWCCYRAGCCHCLNIEVDYGNSSEVFPQWDYLSSLYQPATEHILTLQPLQLHTSNSVWQPYGTNQHITTSWTMQEQCNNSGTFTALCLYPKPQVLQNKISVVHCVFHFSIQIFFQILYVPVNT